LKTNLEVEQPKFELELESKLELDSKLEVELKSK
jgi:hypothetical protein